MVGLIAFASPDKSFITPTSIAIIYTHLLNSCTGSNPAFVTKSTGLSADALLSWFLHRHLPIFFTVRNPFRLSGLCHLENFTVIRKLSPLNGTVQKHLPTLTPLLRRGRLPASPHTTEKLATMIKISRPKLVTLI